MSKEFKPYKSKAIYHGYTTLRDVYVPMSDGQSLCVDIHIPQGEEGGKYPAILAYGQHNKDIQDAALGEAVPAQPAWSHFWFGNIESGDTRFITSRGYVHVIAQARGNGKSGEGSPLDHLTDFYELIEWIAAQDWCDSNVGMCGLSNFGLNQVLAAATQAPHLKAIFPMDPGSFYGFFREVNLGGVLSALFYNLEPMSVEHVNRTAPTELPEPMETLWKLAMQNPDYQMYKNVYNVLSQKGQLNPMGMFFPFLLHPYDDPKQWEMIAGMKKARINIPVYTGSGQYAIDYHFHWQGAQNLFAELAPNVPKKLMLTGPEANARPYSNKELHEEMMKWYDYWLKGIDTGIMDEPMVRYYVTGENKWRTADNWPVPETQWTPMYFDSWERLIPDAIDPDSWQGTKEPDAFVQMTPTVTNKIEKVRYISQPLTEDLTIAGPIAANFFASLDSDDTNWFVTLKDIAPDYAQRTARPGEWELPEAHEQYLTKGMLRASLRELDEEKSLPYKPWHKLTKEAEKKVVPGEINEYNVEVMSVCHTFKAGHRICVEISALDLPDGVCCASNVEYMPYHICRNATVLHKIYRDGQHPSHILLPVIPNK